MALGATALLMSTPSPTIAGEDDPKSKHDRHYEKLQAGYISGVVVLDAAGDVVVRITQVCEEPQPEPVVAAIIPPGDEAELLIPLEQVYPNLNPLLAGFYPDQKFYHHKKVDAPFYVYETTEVFEVGTELGDALADIVADPTTTLPLVGTCAAGTVSFYPPLVA